jgi:hypothetical protein
MKKMGLHLIQENGMYSAPILIKKSNNKPILMSKTKKKNFCILNQPNWIHGFVYTHLSLFYAANKSFIQTHKRPSLTHYFLQCVYVCMCARACIHQHNNPVVG